MLQDLIALTPFALLLVAVLGLWIHRIVWIAALLGAVVAAYVTGALQGAAILWIALLAAAAWMYRWRKSTAAAPNPTRRLIAGLAFFLLALAMGLALLPGFPRVVLVDNIVLSAGAMPYSLGLGFPKVVGGIFIFGLIHVQRELGEIGGNRRVASLLALAVAAVLFGLVHLAGGWKYALAAMLAGAGYGWAYLRTQRLEASMAVHFALNATHFLLFTYPALAWIPKS